MTVVNHKLVCLLQQHNWLVRTKTKAIINAKLCNVILYLKKQSSIALSRRALLIILNRQHVIKMTITIYSLQYLRREQESIKLIMALLKEQFTQKEMKILTSFALFIYNDPVLFWTPKRFILWKQNLTEIFYILFQINLDLL